MFVALARANHLSIERYGALAQTMAIAQPQNLRIVINRTEPGHIDCPRPSPTR